jgi:hypothetical protein
MDDFEHCRQAGRGHSSRVHVVRDRATRTMLALKVCDRASMRESDEARVRLALLLARLLAL